MFYLWIFTGKDLKSGRWCKIRTCDPLDPNQVRYQAALITEYSFDVLHCNFWRDKDGVAKGTWTLDNRNHNPGLYQLSYSHHWTYLKRLLIRRAEYIALIRRLTRKTFAFYCIYTWLLMFYTICATNQQLTYLFYFIPCHGGTWCRRIS